MTHPDHVDPESPAVEPIAVIGLACRVPGAADAAEFWRNLAGGVEAVRFFTLDEQRALGVPESIVTDPNFVPAASLLDEHDGLDANFFGMSVREAEIRDPQHRLLLELSHTALEDAGYDPTRYPGEIGMYATVGPDVYQWLNIRSNPKAYASAGWLAVMISNHPDYAATLASYKLGLRGPSLTMNTACSSSLVAMHLACEALRNGECDMALTGGATIDIPAGHGYLYDEDGITSPDGHCRPFDADAKGTIWGSGGGVVVLKRLSEAIEDGDCIRAVVLGNAINNDGDGKVGFSAPSTEGQAAVIAQTLGIAGVDPRTITYVEAHGTGTALGDPIEVSALSSVYQQGTDQRGWCAIGSVKSNIGHLGQAAGVAALIKVVMSLEQGQIPPSLHYRRPNPKIPFGENPFYVNTELSRWKTNGAPRRAAVSSFGIGGTNAHAILEEPPRRAPAPVSGRPSHLLQLSARTEGALAASRQRLAAHLSAHPDLSIADVAYTLRVGRRELRQRAAVVVSDPADAVAALADPRRVVTGTAGKQPPRVALLFSGQGAQYPGMGAELYRLEPVFREAVDECAEILRAGGDPELADLRGLMFATGEQGATAEERLRQTHLTQPALFVIEYALAKLWRSWGVEPAAMLGHSIGEYVAATLAGVFSLPDALRLVAARGRLMGSMPSGSMLAVQLDEAEVRPLLPDGLSVATVNGPGTCVVAGPTGLVDEFAERLDEDGVGATRLRTSHAFHSPMMDPILAEFRHLVAATERSAPRLPFLSNVTGTWITAEEATDPSYWARHLREPVRFGDGVATLLAEGEWLFLECGPGRQLAGLVRTQLSREAVAPVPSLPGPRDSDSALAVLQHAAGTMWTHGVALSGEAVAPPARRVPLPTYPWERVRAWIEPDAEVAGFSAQTSAVSSRSERDGMPPIDGWSWVPTWHQLTPGPTTEPPPARCLVFTDRATEELGAALRAQGTEVVEVRPGGEYARTADGYVVRPAERADYDALLRDLAAAGDPVERIVHAWTAGPGADPAAGPAATWQAQDRGFFSLLQLVEALAAAAHPERVRLDVLSRGTLDVTGADLVAPEHATVTGIARVVPLELPWLTVSHLDLDPVATDWSSVVDALVRRPETDQAGLCPATAVRGGRRWVQDYRQVPLPDRGGAGLRTGGVYVITGGLGGIGVTVAEDLAWRARARVVLVSRSGLPPRVRWDDHLRQHGTGDRVGRAIAAVRRIEEAGGEALVLAADVTDPEDLRRVREETLSMFGAVHGIVHAAGVPGGGVVEVKQRADAERVLAPKLLGTLALREAFGDLDLDFVLLCSSITAVAGGFGQVDYCAANAFLDAHARSAHGWRGRVLSVDWGGWREVGMAAEVQAPDLLRPGAAAGAADPEHPAATVTPVEHPVVVERHDPGDGRLPWCAGTVSAATHWVLDEHRMAPVPLMPGTGYVEIARAAAVAALPAPAEGRVIELRDLVFVEPMPVPDGRSAELRVVFEADPDGAEFQVRSVADGVVSTHARGGAGWVDPGPTPVVDLEAVRARCAQAGGQGGVALSSLLTYGPHWQNLRTWYTGDQEALALLEANEVVAADLHRWVLHPGILDEATSFARFSVEGHYLPLSYGRLLVRAPMPARMWSHLRFRGGDQAEIIVADVTLLDDEGREIVSITDYVLRRIDPDAVLDTVTRRPDAAPAAHPEPAASPAPAGRGIRPGDGAEALVRLLGTPLGPQVVVTAVPLPTFLGEVGGVNLATIEEGAGSAVATPAAGRAPRRSENYVAPRTELEATVARLFTEVLGGDELGVEDDFFDLGGNSLVAVQLIALVRKQLAVKLPLRSLFEEPTVAGVARLVAQARTEGATADDGASEAASTTIPRQPRRTDSARGA